MKSRLKKALAAFVSVAAIAAVDGVATADQLTADGDTVTASANIQVADCSVGHTYTGLATISYQGNSHFAGGATVTISSTPQAAALTAGITTGGGGTLVLPPSWTNTTADQTKSISVSVPAGIANATYKVDVTASGPKAGGGTHTITDTYNVGVTCPTDTTAPVVTANVSGAEGDNGWYTSDVDVSWAVADAQSTISSQSPACATSTSITSDTSSWTVTCTATSAGGTTTKSVTIKRDATAPRLSCDVPDGAWHRVDVSLACTASDETSGLAVGADASFDLATSVAAGTETANAATGSRRVVDGAGNPATAGPIAGNMVDKKAPTILCDAASVNWSASDQTVHCTATDGGSGLDDSADASFDLSTNVSAGSETNDASTGTRDVEDAVGNASTAGPISGNMVDKRAPQVRCGAADGAWHAADVTVDCDAADGGSGLASSSDAAFGLTTSVPAGTETASASTNSHDVLDQVGNTTTAGPVAGNKVDKKAPQVSCGSADGVWHSANVSIRCTSSDAGSGLADPGDESFDLSTNVATGSESDDAATGSRNVYDGVNNLTTAGPVAGIKVDRKAPTSVAFTGSMTQGGVYPYGTVPAAPTCSAIDGGSGMASCAVTGYATGVGTHTLTATATDNVGNTSTRTLTYTVQPWNLVGFSAPVDNWMTPNDPATRVLNTVKGGSTVPLRFEVFSGTTELTDKIVITSFVTPGFNCTSGSPEAGVEFTTTGGTSLRYDTTGGTFIQNWQTPKSPGKCFDVTLTTQDGSTLTASFKLK